MNPTILGNAIAGIIKKQPFYLRRKGTILITLTSFAWAAAFLGYALAGVSPQFAAAIPGAVTLVTALVNALTQDGIAPSAEGKIIEALAALPGQVAGLDDLRAQLAKATEVGETQGDTQ